MTYLFRNRKSQRILAAGTTALTAFVLLATANVAGAATPADASPTVTVSYDDLNLSSERGALALYQRISAAARQVCPLENSRDLGAFVRSRSCRADAIARAVRAVDNPHLAAVQAAHSSHG